MTLPRRLLHSLSKPSLPNHYITTPIFYVNARPHLGHVYSAVIADSLARFYRLRDGSARVHFVTGTDEHGNKINDAAKSANMDVKPFCDEVSQTFQDVFRNAAIQPDLFVRTTSVEHKKAVEALWSNLQKRNYIYLGHHEGWYCRSDECFVAPGQIVNLKDGSTIIRESGKPVEWLSEPNYKFKLSLFADEIRTWLQQDPSPIQPSFYRKELLALLDQGLQDLSISRQTKSAPWGIPVPNDPTHTIYVWLDALSNYLTAIGYPDRSDIWPPTYQIIGKDILRFHAIYWPAFLLAAGLSLPKCLVVHAHWIAEGSKMSKSVGNVICPNSLSSDLGGPDALRYFLLRHSSIEHDSIFDLDQALSLINRDLAGQFGNLYSRSLALLDPYSEDGIVTNACSDAALSDCELNKVLNALPGQVEDYFGSVKFNLGLKSISDMIASVNKWFSSQEPWTVKNPKDRLQIVAYALNACRVASILLQPVTPNLTGRILDHMRIPIANRCFKDVSSWNGPGPLPQKFSFFDRRKGNTRTSAAVNLE